MNSHDYSHGADSTSDMKMAYYLLFNGEYQGPFALDQIFRLISDRKIHTEHKIWSSGFSDWVTISKIPIFEKKFSALVTETAPAVMTEFTRANDFEFDLFFEEAVVAKTSLPKKDIGEVLAPKMDLEPKITARAWLLRNLKKNVLGLFFCALIVFTLLIYKLKNAESENIDLLRSLSVSEYNEAKSVLLNIENEKELVASLGLVNSGNQVSFIVVSNIPKGKRSTLSLVGVPESLVGSDFFSREAHFVSKNNRVLIASRLVTFDSPIPKGDYIVSYYCEDCQTKTILTEKRYFLGGAKDIQYDLELIEFHKSLRNKARGEIAEFRQLLETLTAENFRFEELHLQKGETGKTGSSPFSLQWSQLLPQLDLVFESWNAKLGKNEVFYSDQFKSIFAIFQMLKERFNTENGKTKDLLLDQQIERVKAELRRMESLPLSSNGMPRKK